MRNERGSSAALRIGFIGAGRVAQTLAPAFDRAGLKVAAFQQPRPRCGDELAGDPGVPSARPMAQAQEVVDSCDWFS